MSKTSNRPPRLARQLALALVVKLALLAALWLACVRPARVTVGAAAMGERVAGTIHQDREKQP